MYRILWVGGWVGASVYTFYTLLISSGQQVVNKPPHLSRRANIIALVEHTGGARRGALENTPTPLAGHLSDLRPRRRDFFGLRVETSWALPHACNTVPKSGALYAYST